MAGLSGNRAIVRVGPPWFARGASLGVSVKMSWLAVEKPPPFAFVRL